MGTTDLKVQEEGAFADENSKNDAAGGDIGKEKAVVEKNETETNIVQDDGERVNTTFDRENAQEKANEESTTIERKS